MGSSPQRLLRCSVACLFLAEAWSHFFWEPPYRAALEAHLDLANALGVAPEAAGRIARGFGIWFLLAGVCTVVWRPGWLGRSFVALGFLPAALSLTARLATSADMVVMAATQALSLCSIVALVIFDNGRRKMSKIPLQAGLTAAFATWSLLAFGIGAPAPANWLTLIQSIWPGGGGDATHLRVLAGLTLGACVCLWIRELVPAAAFILSLAGLAAVVTPMAAQLDSGLFEFFHRSLPGAVGRIGLILLPIVVALNDGPAPLPPQPRRLKRVELPLEESEPV